MEFSQRVQQAIRRDSTVGEEIYPYTVNPQRFPRTSRSLSYLNSNCLALKRTIKGCPIRGFTTANLAPTLTYIRQFIRSHQIDIFQERANIAQKAFTMTAAKGGFTFIQVDMTDEELSAYEKWSRGAEKDFPAYAAQVLADDLKLTISLVDETYYATLVGREEGRYAKMSLTARSDVLFDAMLLVFYKHLEILGTKWVTRKSNRGIRG